MLISLQNRKEQLNNLWLYLLVITTLVGSAIYIGFASLYHFVIFVLLISVLLLGINTADFKTDIMKFLFLWLIEAVISLLWAPDKILALQYVYYIFLINGICVLFHCFLSKKNLLDFCHFMVCVLLLCNIIAFWEIQTGNHLVANYLSTPGRLRLLKYVPGGFYWNSNDFATFIIQIIPFSFAGVFSSKKSVRIVSTLNLAASFVTVCATQSRTQTILLLGMLLFYLFVIPKRKAFAYVALACVATTLLCLANPDMKELINNAVESVSGKALLSTERLEGTSIGIRINLLKNAGLILLDTFGFGIGAGCHRAVMAEYSAMHFNTSRVIVMHNLLGEIFVDYGLIVGVLFLGMIVVSCGKLFHIFKTTEKMQIRVLAIMLFCSLGTFILCGVSSSSVLQLSSVWLIFCFTSAFIKLYKKDSV